MEENLSLQAERKTVIRCVLVKCDILLRLRVWCSDVTSRAIGLSLLLGWNHGLWKRGGSEGRVPPTRESGMRRPVKKLQLNLDFCNFSILPAWTYLNVLLKRWVVNVSKMLEIHIPSPHPLVITSPGFIPPPAPSKNSVVTPLTPDIGLLVPVV